MQYSDIIHKNNPYFIGYYSIFFKRVDRKIRFFINIFYACIYFRKCTAKNTSAILAPSKKTTGGKAKTAKQKAKQKIGGNTNECNNDHIIGSSCLR